MSPRLDVPSPPSNRLTSAPDTEEGRAVRARLGRRDRHDWPWLLEGLREIARGLASAYRDVCSPEDLLGELALRTHERWLEEWLTGPGDVSLGLFLRDRLRDHLRDLRRRADRRGALLSGAVPGSALVETESGARAALLASQPPSPEDALEAREIQRDLAAQGTDRSKLIGLRAAGYEHAEIASRTGLSRQTVGRRLGAMLGVLAGLAAAGALLLATRPESIVPIAPDPTAAGGGDPVAMAPDAGVEDDAAAARPEREQRLDDATDEPDDLERPVVPAVEGPPEGDPFAEQSAPTLRIPAALDPAPATRFPTSREASSLAFRSARAERLRAALALCRREPGGSVRVELRPGEPEDLGVDRVERPCATAAIRRELERGRPDVAQSFRFSIDDDRAVHVVAPPSDESSDPLVVEADACGDDDACIVRVLADRASSPAQLARLFEAQSSRTMPAACATLERLLQRHPASIEATRLRPRRSECVTTIDDLISAPRR